MLAIEGSRCAVARVDNRCSGGHSGGVTPVPIPNTEVKPASADGTWGENPWESRSPPDFRHERPRLRAGPLAVLPGTLGACLPRPQTARARRAAEPSEGVLHQQPREVRPAPRPRAPMRAAAHARAGPAPAPPTARAAPTGQLERTASAREAPIGTGAPGPTVRGSRAARPPDREAPRAGTACPPGGQRPSAAQEVHGEATAGHGRRGASPGARAPRRAARWAHGPASAPRRARAREQAHAPARGPGLASARQRQPGRPLADRAAPARTSHQPAAPGLQAEQAARTRIATTAPTARRGRGPRLATTAGLGGRLAATAVEASHPERRHAARHSTASARSAPARRARTNEAARAQPAPRARAPGETRRADLGVGPWATGKRGPVRGPCATGKPERAIVVQRPAGPPGVVIPPLPTAAAPGALPRRHALPGRSARRPPRPRRPGVA